VNADNQFSPQLVEEAKTNTEAFANLYDYFFPKVYGFVMSKVGSEEIAEDIVSEVFIKLLENLHKYEERGLPFAAWLFTIARNTIFDHYAKSKKTENVSLDESIEIKDEKKENSPADIAVATELKDKVKAVMNKLPEREVTILQMKFFSGLNNREIAAALDLSESNIGIILYRVLRKIKPDLNNLF